MGRPSCCGGVTRFGRVSPAVTRHYLQLDPSLRPPPLPTPTHTPPSPRDVCGGGGRWGGGIVGPSSMYYYVQSGVISCPASLPHTAPDALSASRRLIQDVPTSRQDVLTSRRPSGVSHRKQPSTHALTTGDRRPMTAALSVSASPTSGVLRATSGAGCEGGAAWGMRLASDDCQVGRTDADMAGGGNRLIR